MFSWVVAHEPSALLIFGADADAVRRLDPNGRVAQAPPAFALACSAARDGHAALLVILPAVPANRERTLSRALDCGYAIARDDGGLVIAPR